MAVIILTILLFALPLAMNNHCYYIGAIKNSILYIVSIWLIYILWLKKPKRPDISILLFFGWVAISFLVSPFKLSDPAEALLTYACYLAVYLSARDYFTADMLKTCLEWLIYILTIIFVYTFWGKFDIIFNNLYKLKNYGLYEFRGTFGQAGVYGCWLAMAIPFLLVRKRWIACFLGLFLLWLTSSRASIIGVILAVSVLYYAISNRIWIKIGIILTGLLLITGIFYKYGDKIGIQVDRVSFWDSAIQMTIDKPIIGYGIGSFRINYPKYRNPLLTSKIYNTVNLDLQHAHSLYFEMGSEIGIVGVLLFLFMVWKHFKMNNNWGLISGIFACLIANLTDVSFYFVPIGFMFWLYMGLLAKEKKKPEEIQYSSWVESLKQFSDYCFWN